jgi:hypothetical protein
MPNVQKPYGSVRKLLQLSLALLLCTTALGIRNAHADPEAFMCLNCQAYNPCTGQVLHRSICCAASSGTVPHCQVIPSPPPPFGSGCVGLNPVCIFTGT